MANGSTPSVAPEAIGAEEATQEFPVPLTLAALRPLKVTVTHVSALLPEKLKLTTSPVVAKLPEEVLFDRIDAEVR